MKFKRDWSWVFSANSLFRVKIIIICKYSLKKSLGKTKHWKRRVKIVITGKEYFWLCMTEATKLQNVRLLFPNKKSLPWPVPLWSKYLVFTVSLPQPQYWGRSLSYQISNTAASSRSRHHNHFQYGESVKSGAVEIPHDTCRCRCRKHWTTWVLKTERMIYLQIRLKLQLYTLALMGYTFYLSSVKTWFYTASHSSAHRRSS